MLHTEVMPVAQELLEFVRSYCDKSEIAGSLRRKKEYVNDAELVIQVKPGMYNSLFNKLGMYFLKMNSNFKYIKNGDKYKQFFYKGIKIDLFITQPDNWGLIFMIRTGSADYAKSMLQKWKYVTKGGYSEDGYLYTKDGKKVLTFEEKEVFALCRAKYVEPESR